MVVDVHLSSAAVLSPSRVLRRRLAGLCLVGCLGVAAILYMSGIETEVPASSPNVGRIDGTAEQQVSQGHGHGVALPTVPLTDSERTLLEAELVEVRAAVPYRTVADAMDAGFVSLQADEGDNDVHLINWSRMDGVFDPSQPEQLIASSDRPDGKILAVVFYLISDSSFPPEGFAGGQDQWHDHRGVCIDGTRARGEQMTQRACELFGKAARLVDGWMLHVWALPGYSNPDGLFVAE